MKVDPKRIYTATDILREKIFPWARHHVTLSKLISNDMTGENILETVIEKNGTKRRYKIKGQRIIKFLKKYGSYLEMGTRKTKQWQKKKK